MFKNIAKNKNTGKKLNDGIHEMEKGRDDEAIACCN
jgi:hypothetical protein